MGKIYKIFGLIFLCVLFVSFPELSFAEKSFLFKGEIDFSKNEFNIIVDLDEKSSVEATAQRISENDYRLLLDIEHIKTPLFDLLSKIESSVEIIPNKNVFPRKLTDATFRGKIWSKYSLVDYKPAGELAGGFEIKNQRLHLTALSFGNLKCDGYIDLVAPYELNLGIKLYNIAMSDFLNFWSANNEYNSSGVVSGKIKASGTIGQLVLKGDLESKNGFVQKLDYDSIALNIEGVYPNMLITQSTISKSDGVSFTLGGPFDLSDRVNFKRQIKDLTLAPLVSDSGSEREWIIKRLNQEASATTGVTEFKYRVRQGNALGIGTTAEDETDMFGLEQTRKF